MPNQQLIDYIKQAKISGMEDSAIRQNLLGSGNSVQDIEEAFITLGVGPKRASSPKNGITLRKPSSSKKFLKIFVIVIIFIVIIAGSYVLLNNYFPQYAKYADPYLRPIVELVSDNIGVSGLGVPENDQPIYSRNKVAEEIKNIQGQVTFSGYYPKPDFQDQNLGRISQVKEIEQGINPKFNYFGFEITFTDEKTVKIIEKNMKEWGADSLLENGVYKSLEWKEEIIAGQKIKYYEKRGILGEEGNLEFTEDLFTQLFLINKSDLEILVIAENNALLNREGLINMVLGFQELPPGKTPLTNSEKWGFDVILPDFGGLDIKVKILEGEFLFKPSDSFYFEIFYNYADKEGNLVVFEYNSGTDVFSFEEIEKVCPVCIRENFVEKIPLNQQSVYLYKKLNTNYLVFKKHSVIIRIGSDEIVPKDFIVMIAERF
jgi:hypothetical protein